MSSEPRQGSGPVAVTVFVAISLAVGVYAGYLVHSFSPAAEPVTEAHQPPVAPAPDLREALEEANLSIAELEQEAEGLRDELGAARAEADQREATITELTTDLAAFEELVNALAEEASVAQQEAARLGAELQATRERVAFLEARNRTLAGDLELALSDAARARQLLDMRTQQHEAGAFAPPPLAEVSAPPPPPAAPKPEPVDVRPVVEALLAFTPDAGQGAIQDSLGLEVVLQSPARLELGGGPLVTMHRFDAYSGDLLSSELTVRSGEAAALAPLIAGHLLSVMGEPLSGSAETIAVGGRVQFQTASSSATLILQSHDRLLLTVEHTGLAAAPIQLFRLDSSPTAGADSPTIDVSAPATPAEETLEAAAPTDDGEPAEDEID